MIRLENLTLGYGSRTLLDGVSAVIPAGALTALVGRNGTGKSTLLRALVGLERIRGGRVLLDGRELARIEPRRLAATAAFVATGRVRIPNLRCRDVVAFGRAPYTNWFGRMQAEDAAIVGRALEAVGMEGFADRALDTMSDGECQRVMIARALAQQTPVILLDEPTFAAAPAGARGGQVHPLLDARTGHRPFAVRCRRADRPAPAALPADGRDDPQRPDRTAVRPLGRAVRRRDRNREDRPVAVPGGGRAVPERGLFGAFGEIA